MFTCVTKSLNPRGQFVFELGGYGNNRATELIGENGLRDWIEMCIKTPLGTRTNATIRAAIVQQAVSELKDSLYQDRKWYADYVRLRMKAIKI